MSINFIVEDGTGKENATSYASIDFIDSYAVDLGYNDWDTYSITTKQKYANQATQYIDLSFNFYGKKADENQALEFPRERCYDTLRHRFLETDEIIAELKKAVAEISINAGLSDSRLIQATGEVLKKEKVGDIEVERFTPSATQIKYPQVIRLLRGVGDYSLTGGPITLTRG